MIWLKSQSKKLIFLQDQDTAQILCQTQNSTMSLTWWRNLTIQVRIYTWQVLLVLNIPLDLYPVSSPDCGIFSVVKKHVHVFMCKVSDTKLLHLKKVFCLQKYFLSLGLSNPAQYERQYSWIKILSQYSVWWDRLQESCRSYIRRLFYSLESVMFWVLSKSSLLHV